MDQQNPHYPRIPQQQTSYFPTTLRLTSTAAPPFLRLGSPDQEPPFYLPINEQTLNAAFASLSLSAPAPPHFFPTNPDPPFFEGPTPGLGGPEGFAPPPPPQFHHHHHQYNQYQYNDNDSVVSLKKLRFQNGQMGSGLGPLNPLVGPTPPSPPATAAAPPLFRGSSWPYGSDGLDLVLSPSSYGCLGEFDYVGSKKYPNAQFTSTSSTTTSCCSNGEAAGKKVVLDFVDMKGRFVSLAKDQHCSKMLQVKLLELSEGEIDVLLTEIMDYIGDLMKNQFGNYVVQKLITVCNENQRTRIILSVRKTVSQLISICLNQHGTRGIQKLLETVTCPLQVSLLMAAISPGAATLANDQNGHHVIVYCLKYFSSEDNVHLLNDIAANCFEVAIDKSGCCVMQTCLHTRGRAREHLVNEIIAIALHLAEHPYGNYVLQHMLGLKELNITTNLLRQLEGHYLSISCNKYGSNVVEKCLVETTEEQSSRVILELVRSPNASMILRDPFGNFVIQLALSVAKGLARNALVQLILMNASTMRTNIYGKKILSCLEKKKIKLV